MVSKKVALILNEDGEKKVVGEAVLDLHDDDRPMDMTARITDLAYARRLFNAPPSDYSVAYSEKELRTHGR